MVNQGIFIFTIVSVFLLTVLITKKLRVLDLLGKNISISLQVMKITQHFPTMTFINLQRRQILLKQAYMTKLMYISTVLDILSNH